ncbi:MAG: hypothetical protein ACTSRA_15420 [Promethearchaeota archaeon]
MVRGKTFINTVCESIIMGVYHVSGLGLSPGAFTVPFIYHVERLIRSLNLGKPDPFFELSGEMGGSDLKGNIEGIILITTPEVFDGSYCENKNFKRIIVDNKVWRESVDAEYNVNSGERRELVFNITIRKVMEHYNRLSDLIGGRGVRNRLSVYVLLIDRNNDFWDTLKKLAVVFGFLKGSGGLGKETWINFTGGNNTIQHALLITLSLHRSYSRVYYYQVEMSLNKYLSPIGDFNPQGIEDPDPNCWIDLPIITGDLDRFRQQIIKEVNIATGGISMSELKSKISNLYDEIIFEVGSLSDINDYLRNITRQLANQDFIKIVKGIGGNKDLYAPTPLGKKMMEFINNKDKLLANYGGGLNELAKKDFASSWFKRVDIDEYC